ncbi:hypothetical protein Tco_0578432 [Tanacetum coccineum]
MFMSCVAQEPWGGDGGLSWTCGVGSVVTGVMFGPVGLNIVCGPVVGALGVVLVGWIGGIGLLENMKGKSVEIKFDKPLILGKPPADKLLINSKIPKSWFTPTVVVQKDLSKPITIQSLPKNEKDHLLK